MHRIRPTLAALVVTLVAVAPATVMADPFTGSGSTTDVHRSAMTETISEGAHQLDTAHTPLDPHRPSATVLDHRLIWDADADFRRAPDAMNPSPDGYGNPDVWSYLESERFDHDPTQYSLLPTYQIGEDGVGQQWHDPGFQYLLVAHRSDLDALHLHPYGGAQTKMVIVGWRSPVSGDVTVEGSVSLADRACTGVGSGVTFTVDHETHIAHRAVLLSGGREEFQLTATVANGDSLYFVLDPGRDSNCDTTHLRLTISHLPAELPDTSMAAPTARDAHQ